MRLDGLFFSEFLKHVPIIHPILGRQQITEDDQLTAIACALGSLAADDVPPDYICAIWMQTYKRVSTKVVRSLHPICPFPTFAKSAIEGRGNRSHARFSFGILLPSCHPNFPVTPEYNSRHDQNGHRGMPQFL